jgi:Repeat of unknown function (DUF5650)
MFSKSRSHRSVVPSRLAHRLRAHLSIHALEDRVTPSAPFSEFIDPHPAAGNQFGATVLPLSTGNVVIMSPYDDAGATDAGAVYLFNGATGALISTLVGSHANDAIGNGGVIALSNGNFVVCSPSWDNGAVTDAGAATFGSGTSGVSGTVNAGNSLVGSTANDDVGGSVTALSNGNYVVISQQWSNGAAIVAGAMTFGSGASGISGPVSAVNSLVGSKTNDAVGSGGVTTLNNGNYVVISPNWDNGAVINVGAATLASGTSGNSGAVSAANSLVGSTANDFVGIGGVTALSSGNYVVNSYGWHNGAVTNAGAVTWGNGTTGISGAVSAGNSLVGSTANDNVGSRAVTVLSNGNYVVSDTGWDNGAATNAGAATWGSGTSGISGAITASNSLVGSHTGDAVGSIVTALSNGNYVVGSPRWQNGAAILAGAATFGNGTSGISGAVSASNSLVGSSLTSINAYDQVGSGGVTALSNGNYVVSSPNWNNGSTTFATYSGAATFGSGTSGIIGTVSASNSLVGNAYDQIGSGGVTALSSGNYVVTSQTWDNGAVTDAGAVTFGNGTSGISGAVSAGNSLVGSTANDNVGSGVTVLSNGNYVVTSQIWDNGAVTDAGAVTFGNGASGISGIVTSSNSLVGSTANDLVGDHVTALSNGNFVVSSLEWDNGAVTDAGAVTFGNGASGISGAVSAGNSLVGSNASDSVGSGVMALSNGNYAVGSPHWHNSALVDAGAVTWGNGTSGITGTITSANSAIGAVADTNLGSFPVVDNVNGMFCGQFVDEAGGRVRVGSQATGFAPPKVSAIVINNNAAQRSRVTSIAVVFDSIVSFSGLPASAFTLTNQKTNTTVVLAASVNNSGPGTVVTLTFTGGPVDGVSLADGRYTLMALAAQIPNLDGNGDGTPGDSYLLIGDPATNTLFRLFGDANGDGAVGANDFVFFRQSYNGVNDTFDFDGDGFVSTSDFTQFRNRFNTSI